MNPYTLENQLAIGTRSYANVDIATQCNFFVTLPLAESAHFGPTHAIPHHDFGPDPSQQSNDTFAVSYGGNTVHCNLVFNNHPRVTLGWPAIQHWNLLPTPQVATALNYLTLSLDDLRAACHQQGLDQNGTKQQLLIRLITNIQ